MRLIVQKRKLEQVVNDFYCATGVRLAVLNTSYNTIVTTEYKTNAICRIIQRSKYSFCIHDDTALLQRCALSKKPETHICHAGLIDIGIPLIYNDEIIGYIIMGQLRSGTPFEAIEVLLSSDNAKALREIYEAMPIYDSERAQSITNLASMLALYIMTEGMIKAERRGLTEDIVNFIRKNLSEPLSVDFICRYIGISKNTLYRNIKLHSGMSVAQYIQCERINEAKKLLTETNNQINQICEQVGIKDSAYFCKIFKNETGMTPLKFRNTKN